MKPITHEEMPDGIEMAMSAGPDRVKGFIELKIEGDRTLFPVDSIAEVFEGNRGTYIHLKHRTPERRIEFQGTLQEFKRKILEAQQ